ncbi:hypothetical protein U1Q18_011778 [Sarracenia purpurea var. burkii]
MRKKKSKQTGYSVSAVVISLGLRRAARRKEDRRRLTGEDKLGVDSEKTKSIDVNLGRTEKTKSDEQGRGVDLEENDEELKKA